MSETTKDKTAEDEKAPKKDWQDKGTWSKDQREKGYYYDDSHGYEIYNPEEDDEDDEC